jgi:hypothetical protein
VISDKIALQLSDRNQLMGGALAEHLTSPGLPVKNWQVAW